MSIGTATAKAKAFEPERDMTPLEAWAAVGALKINLAYWLHSQIWRAEWRNPDTERFVEAFDNTALSAIEKLLAQIGVEVAHD